MPLNDASHDQLERSLAQLDLAGYIALRQPYHPSPARWEDQVFYFLMLDRFSNGQESRTAPDGAGRLGLYVILDIILNHAGDVFAYAADRYPAVDGSGRPFMDPRWDGAPYAVQGYRNAFGDPVIPFGPIDPRTHPQAWPNDGVWPAELQSPGTFTRKGHISNYDYDPEYLEGDFESLKDIDQGEHDRDAS